MHDWRTQAMRVFCRTGVAVAFVVTLFTNTLVAGEDTTMPLTKEGMPAHVAKTFAHVYGNLYFRNPLDGTYHPFPELPADSFSVVGEKDDAWIVSHEPLSGPTVFATVDKQSGRVSFDRIVVSTE